MGHYLKYRIFFTSHWKYWNIFLIMFQRSSSLHLQYPSLIRCISNLKNVLISQWWLVSYMLWSSVSICSAVLRYLPWSCIILRFISTFHISLLYFISIYTYFNIRFYSFNVFGHVILNMLCFGSLSKVRCIPYIPLQSRCIIFLSKFDGESSLLSSVHLIFFLSKYLQFIINIGELFHIHPIIWLGVFCYVLHYPLCIWFGAC